MLISYSTQTVMSALFSAGFDKCTVHRFNNGWVCSLLDWLFLLRCMSSRASYLHFTWIYPVPSPLCPHPGNILLHGWHHFLYVWCVYSFSRICGGQGQLYGVCFLLPPSHGFWGLRPVTQFVWQPSVYPEPSCWPQHGFPVGRGPHFAQ